MYFSEQKGNKLNLRYVVTVCFCALKITLKKMKSYKINLSRAVFFCFQLVTFAILAVAAAAPQLRSSQEAQLVQFESDNDGLGTYRYA